MADSVNIRGAEIIVTTTPDNHSAYLTIKPPAGGKCNLTCAEVVRAINEKGVRYNINEENITKMLEKEMFVDQMEVAVWTPAIDGVDGTITYRYSMTTELVPQVDENGHADYKNLGYVRPIEKGDVIADITLPTQGESGKDVRGVVIRQKIGRAANYRRGQNVVVSEDGLSLVAAETGHLSFEGGCFNIHTTLVIPEDVDASTGNIEFVGDVTVKGFVREGFKVSSAKNITVVGNANGASLEAGGNITVKNGVINSTVVAHGDVNAQFCEHSNITADGSITAANFVFCNCYAGGELKAVKSISGGKYTSINNAQAGSAGNENYVKTEIIIGDNSLVSEEKANLEKYITDIDNQLVQCTQIIDFLKEKSKQIKLPEDKQEMLGKAIKTKYTLTAEKKKTTARIAEIEERLAIKQFLRFDVKGKTYHGVKVTISGNTYKVNGELARTSFRLNEAGELQAFPL